MVASVKLVYIRSSTCCVALPATLGSSESSFPASFSSFTTYMLLKQGLFEGRCRLIVGSIFEQILSLPLTLQALLGNFLTPFLIGALILLIFSSDLLPSNLSSTSNLFTEIYKVPDHESAVAFSRTSSCNSSQNIAVPFGSRNANRSK